jgi:hypothetical protein
MYGGAPDSLLPELARIDAMVDDGIVRRDGYQVAVPASARPYLRSVCAVFDSRLSPEATRHSRAF